MIADLEARIAAMMEAVAALRKAKDALGVVGLTGGGSWVSGEIQVAAGGLHDREERARVRVRLRALA